MNFSDLAIKVIPGLTGIPDFVAEERARDAVVEFCRASWIYEADITSITTSAGDGTYPITPDSGMVVVAVLYVKDENDALLNYQVSSDYAEITLADTPADAFDITIRAVMTPDPVDGTSFPDFIYDRFKREIIAGAKAECLDMPNKPWTDHTEADRQRKIFKAGITRAKIDIATGRLGSSRVQMRAW